MNNETKITDIPVTECSNIMGTKIVEKVRSEPVGAFFYDNFGLCP